MKKIIVASILGIAACAGVSTSYGQGSLIFGNYSFGASNFSAPVTYGAGNGGLSGTLVGNTFTATLLYSSTGTAGTFNAVAGSQTPFYSDSDVSGFQGLFAQVGVTIPTYVSGNAFFEVQASGPGFIGTSGVVVFSTLATAANLHTAGSMFQDNPDVSTPLAPFTVAPVPEPSTLALAGLGGLASLLALRRKRS